VIEGAVPTDTSVESLAMVPRVSVAVQTTVIVPGVL
jgi:hypothetical protein